MSLVRITLKTMATHLRPNVFNKALKNEFTKRDIESRNKKFYDLCHRIGRSLYIGRRQYIMTYNRRSLGYMTPSIDHHIRRLVRHPSILPYKDPKSLPHSNGPSPYGNSFYFRRCS
jgi:hypothetical protein